MTCDPAVPKAACDQLRAAAPAGDVSLAPCKAGDTNHVGTWSYAVVAPQYTPTESIAKPDLAAKWTAGALAASAETQAAVATLLGATSATPVTGRPDVGPGWAIVPAHELVPAWQVVAVDRAHPLANAATQPLALPLCTSAAVTMPSPIANIDPDKLTVIAMTGTTAPTRNLGRLIEAKGTTYPARDVKSWFDGADFVHVSNEVAFVPGCDGIGKEIEFCAKEKYIQLLEQVHPSIIELTGSHLSDYGPEQIDHTLEMYKQRGWRWFGGGHDQVEATTPQVFEHHGNRFALLGCNMVRTTSKLIRDQRPDTAACDLRRMDWQIRDLRAHGIVPIVSIQHEEVYHHDPPDVIVTDFRRLAAAGAEFVFGSQAHCAHPWEVHDGAYLHYGAGNFFFDQDAPNTRDGTADRLYLYANHLLTVGHLYTRIEEKGRPRPMTDRERADYLELLAKTLAKLPKASPWAPNKLAPPERQHADSFWMHHGSQDGNQDVLVYVPPAADKLLLPGGGAAPGADKTFALTIYLHREDLAGGSIDKVASRGLPAQLATSDLARGASQGEGGERSDLPKPEDGFVASPHLVAGHSWSDAVVERVKQWMLAKYPIDPAKVTIRRE